MEYESEEEILVYAEFDENVDILKYRSIHPLGIDNKNPIIQMDDTFFSGKYSTPVGTLMFFEEDHHPPTGDTVFNPTPTKPLKYLCKTRKLLKMEHTYVTPLQGTENQMENQEILPDDDIEIANFTSVPEAIQRFKDYLKPSSQPKDANTSIKAEPSGAKNENMILDQSHQS